MIDFIIIGAQKGGTTAAAFNLNKHPEISVFSNVTEYGQYEIEFFNQHWERGERWYFEQLPKSKRIVGEKTAELLHRMICHERIFKVQPNVKLIVILRSPIYRAYSQWRMAVFTKKDETRSFEEVIFAEYKMLEKKSFKEDFYNCKEKEISCWREGYIVKGFYYEQLQNLIKYFPLDNIHIAISERVYNNKTLEYNKIFNFLKVNSLNIEFENKFIGKTTEAMSNKVYNKLKLIYEKPNQELFNLLGYRIEEW